jgi:ABC transporter substrate binding protein (PQQ-dependent alcohol dehydrogenase system)
MALLLELGWFRRFLARVAVRRNWTFESRGRDYRHIRRAARTDYAGGMQRMTSLLAGLGLAALAAASHAAPLDVRIAYLEQVVAHPPTLSNLDPLPEDLGLAGAEIALGDNLTTGSFLGHDYVLDLHVVPPGEDVLAAARAALAETPLVVVNAPADTLLAIADLPEAQDALIFNAAAPEVRLRDADCRANVLHTIASYDMRADALMQFLIWKRWRGLAMLVGPNPPDAEFAEALRRSAAKFGLGIGAEKAWDFTTDMRRSATVEVPSLTQDLGDYDVLLVADEVGDFGQYVLYNTWEARPVAGSEGLSPRTWSGALEQWAAVQLQNRFEAHAGREMRSEDYGAWSAVRAIGEAVTRTGTADPAALRRYMLSADFRLDGFKGAILSFRSWNGQLRQPIPLVHPRALVALAPMEGFLHRTSELDTLGLDAPESGCLAFE